MIEEVLYLFHVIVKYEKISVCSFIDFLFYKTFLSNIDFFKHSIYGKTVQTGHLE